MPESPTFTITLTLSPSTNEAFRKRVIEDLAPQKCPERRHNLVSAAGIVKEKENAGFALGFRCPGRKAPSCKSCPIRTKNDPHHFKEIIFSTSN
ncbi:MAG: hypothetical protein AAB697_02525 [Patescibacteria group bacterium]